VSHTTVSAPIAATIIVRAPRLAADSVAFDQNNTDLARIR
jgi:hypothetical protein